MLGVFFGPFLTTIGRSISYYSLMDEGKSVISLLGLES